MATVLRLRHTGQEITVRDWGEVASVLEKEYAHWQWLLDANFNVGNAANALTSSYQALINQARTLQSQGENLADVGSILAPFLDGNLLHHESENGALILEIRDIAGPRAAGYALAFLRGSIGFDSIRTPEALRGVMLLAFPSMSDATDMETRLRQERENYRSSLKSAIAAVRRGQSEREDRWRAMVHSAKKLGVSQLRKAKDSANQLQKSWMENADSAVASVRQTEATYNTFMGLRAPAAYWEKKSVEHGEAKAIDLTNIKTYFCILIVVLIAAFMAAGYLIYSVHDAKNEPVALYVLISGGLAVLSTIGFWIGRILTKLYLSEHHLKTDAEERRVMIMTYLALVENQAASAEEKTIILNAIFRSTADGIVKDDGPPDVGLQAFASKLLAGK